MTDEVTKEQYSDMADDYSLRLDAIRQALGVDAEPHQTLHDRMMDAVENLNVDNDRLRARVAEMDRRLGQKPCQYSRCPALVAERRRADKLAEQSQPVPEGFVSVSRLKEVADGHFRTEQRRTGDVHAGIAAILYALIDEAADPGPSALLAAAPKPEGGAS